ERSQLAQSPENQELVQWLRGNPSEQGEVRPSKGPKIFMLRLSPRKSLDDARRNELFKRLEKLIQDNPGFLASENATSGEREILLRDWDRERLARIWAEELKPDFGDDVAARKILPCETFERALFEFPLAPNLASGQKDRKLTLGMLLPREEVAANIDD